MAATVSPATGRHYGVARVCQVWDVPRSSFYAARQAAAAAGPAKLPGSPRTKAGGLRRRPARRHQGRPRPLALDRRGAPKGLGPPAGDRRHPRLAQARPAPDARARPALAASRPPARRGGARPPHHHRGAEYHVGDRCHPDHHRPGRQGLAVRGRRALERRTARLARRQARHPLRGHPGRSAWRSASSSATSPPVPPAAWRSATTTAATSWPTTSRSRSGSGAWRRATPSSASPRRRMMLNSPFLRSMLFFPSAWVTAWRRAGHGGAGPAAQPMVVPPLRRPCAPASAPSVASRR